MNFKYINFFVIFYLIFVIGVNGVCYQARNLGIKCDGRTDDTEALNRAISSMKERDRIYLPGNAVCIISDNIRISEKKDFMLIGNNDGQISEILARQPENSAIIISDSDDIMLAHIKLNSQNTDQRVGSSLESSGVAINSSKNIYIESMTITNQMGMGVFVHASTLASVRLSKISDVRHHGVHIQGASENIHVIASQVSNVGRDGLSVIDWGWSKKSAHIGFTDNTIRMTNYTGIRVGTAESVEIQNNKIYQTLFSGIMIQVAAGGTNNVVIRNNLIEDSPRVRERQNERDTGIRVAAHGQNHEFVNINKNTIRNPKSRPPTGSWAPHGIQCSTEYGASIQTLYISDNNIVDNSKEITQCINDPEQQRIFTTRILRNKLNDVECAELIKN